MRLQNSCMIEGRCTSAFKTMLQRSILSHVYIVLYVCFWAWYNLTSSLKLCWQSFQNLAAGWLAFSVMSTAASWEAAHICKQERRERSTSRPRQSSRNSCTVAEKAATCDNCQQEVQDTPDLHWRREETDNYYNNIESTCCQPNIFELFRLLNKGTLPHNHLYS